MHARTLLVGLLFVGAASASPRPSPSPVVVESHSPAISVDGALVEAVGVGLQGGVFSPVLVAGCQMPCEGFRRFSNAAHNQPGVGFRLFRGTDTKIATATYLGTFQVKAQRSNGMLVRLFVEGNDLKLEAIDVQTNLPYEVVKVAPRP